MIGCWFFRKKLPAFVSKELLPGEEEKVRRHIEKCAGCRQEAAEYEKIIRAAGEEEKPFLSEVFWRKFDERLDMRINSGRDPVIPVRFSFAPSLRPAYAAVIAVLILLALLLPLRSRMERYVENRQEEELITSALILDKAGISVLNHSEDAYIDELMLLDEFDSV